MFNTRAETDAADLNTLYDVLKKRKELPLLEEALSKMDLTDEGIRLVNDALKE